MDIVVANGFAMESCTFFSREYHCCVLHNTRCKCEDYNPRNSKPITKADRIRAMSDEELANKISAIESFALTCGGGWPPEKWLDWLKEEAKE